jgi:two-component system invasion response regulator UvrY
MNKKISIGILDDHPIMRKGLINILKESMDSILYFEFSNFDELLSFLKKDSLNVLLLDISLKEENGFEILDYLIKFNKEINIIMISALSEDYYAYKSIKAGAKAFISKDAALEDLVTTINLVLNGKKYVNPTLVANIISEEKDDQIKTLSNRESLVLYYTANGLSNNEIGEKLFLSPKTVSTYKNRVKQKLNLKSNHELLLYCIQNNIIKEHEKNNN